MEQFISNGANVDEQNKYGYTALMVAAEGGHTAAVELLIKRNASLNLISGRGFTALILAAYYGQKDTSELLLKAGADKAMKTGGRTAAQWASDRGHAELAALLESWKTAADPVCLISLPLCVCVYSA